MDIFNDYYPLYPNNPDKENLSDSELSEIEEYKNTLFTRRKLSFDEWILLYSDDLWHTWSMIKDFNNFNILPFFNKLDYGSFCHIVYQNSTN
jgi:hypothetical protein